NHAPRLDLLEVQVGRNQADSAVRQLEEIRRIPPAPPAEARVYLDSAIQLLRAQKVAEARGPLDRFAHVLATTRPYQASRDDVKWTEGPVPGRPVLTFNPTYLIGLRGVRTRATIDSVKFVDVTDNSGVLDAERRDNPAGAAATALAAGATVALAIGDVDGDGTDDLFLSVWSAQQAHAIPHLFRMRGGFARDV